MTMAAAIENPTADADNWSKPGRIAAIELVHDLAGAEAIWRGLEGQRVLHALSALRLRRAWQRNVGEHEGLAPFIVIAFDRERRPLMLLPLARQARLWRALRQLHGRQALDFQHGAVGQGICRDRNARRSRRA